MTKVKVTYKMLNAAYDLLWELAQSIIRDRNPCNFIRGGKSNIISCLGFGPQANATLCCGGYVVDDFDYICPHVGPNGCKVKSLRCALWYCEACNVDGKFPHVHFQRDVVSITPIIGRDHLELIKQMKHWKFDGVFREGKGAIIKSAYKSFQAEGGIEK